MKINYKLISIMTLYLLIAFDQPQSFQFNQSSLQAFYFIISAEVDTNPIEGEDWIAAFKGETCVGSVQWEGPYTTVPAMGDDGNEWSDGYMLTGDIPEFYIWDASDDRIIHVVSSENYPWANNGFFNIQTLPLDEQVNLPIGFSIKTYPNPFNGKVSILIDSDTYSKIEVLVFDLNGRLVDKLYSNNVFRGTTNLVWDGGQLPSGIYFLQVVSSDISFNKPMTKFNQKLLLVK
ncbi:MAG: T9SS type A sorting domain-containing protein [Candidatus Marinimicrobia bacterium]|nr:T9SS type A sorting domain-containing protein [Candidatus Neomarinimicrobiota bacterium]